MVSVLTFKSLVRTLVALSLRRPMLDICCCNSLERLEAPELLPTAVLGALELAEVADFEGLAASGDLPGWDPGEKQE